MFVHTVFFWMKEELSPDQARRFEQGLAGLLEIPGCEGGWAGPPAHTPRDVVDNSYAYGFTVLFEDVRAHDVYQDCDAHQQFIAEFKPLWARVQVYDFVSP